MIQDRPVILHLIREIDFMKLFHPFIWPFVLIGLSLLITYLTALDLPGKLRARVRNGLHSRCDDSKSSPQTVIAVRIVRNNSIFWFCAGIVTLATALVHGPWNQPGRWLSAFVGLFWIFIGVKMFRSNFPRKLALRHSNGELFRIPQIVTQIADRACASGQVGLVIGTIAGNEEFLHGFGALKLGGMQPPDAETVFEIGSITKAFTGILLAQAVESGELNLDDRIADLLPQGWTLPEPARAITLRHCTTHTSGLPRLPSGLIKFKNVFRMAFLGSDPYRDYTEDQFRQALATVKLHHEPGTKSEYSNFGAGLLGFVLARHYGSTFETLVKSRICQPLGMSETGITPDERSVDRMPSKYRSILKLGPLRYGLESDDWRLPDHLSGAGAIRSTGLDMMTFLKANMGLVSNSIDNAIRRSHQELFCDPAGLTIGMNWIRSFDDELGQNIIWHNGGTGGFRTYLGFTEDRRFGVFVLGNTASSVDAIAIDILKSLVLRNSATAAPE
jgi:CubicO group peptidase (beta-lactamase class C family)